MPQQQQQMQEQQQPRKEQQQQQQQFDLITKSNQAMCRLTNKSRPQRWSNFEHDGMVNGFCQSTIVVDGFSMVFLQLDHCH